MPYPVQVTPERILEQAGAMIDAEGAAALSLGRLAAALGIKAPSLYRYFASKDALIRALNEQHNRRLFAVMDAADAEGVDAGETALARLARIAHAYRAFAKANASAYVLAMTTREPDQLPDVRDDEPRVLVYQRLLAELVGEAESLAAIRGLLALMHGYVMLELHNQFRRSGGDFDATYDAAVRAFLNGLAQR
ncbi:MAG: TetR/AcrR family transcriptional regulator [bacterium]|nr:TetR/AcrR family transcriptional regulator [bacterium]